MEVLVEGVARRICGGRWLLELLSLFLEILYSLFLFPDHVLHLLVLIEEAIDVNVCVVRDGMAELSVGFWVGGGVFVEAVQGDRFFEQDRVKADHLVGCEVGYSLFQHFELMDGLLNGPGRVWGIGCGLGVGSQGCGQCVG